MSAKNSLCDCPSYSLAEAGIGVGYDTVPEAGAGTITELWTLELARLRKSVALSSHVGHRRTLICVTILSPSADCTPGVLQCGVLRVSQLACLRILESKASACYIWQAHHGRPQESSGVRPPWALS